jgi:glyoxylase-like metal-dependent hydrolase (beta-lactamase superfamily II)
MIETADFEEVTQIRMSREIDGKPVFWVAAYLVDGLLIDTGCHYTAGELAAFLDGSPPTQIVNTHFHEDHIGGNRLLMETFRVPIYAHPDSIPLIGRKTTLFPYQELVWGYPEPTEVRPVPPIVRTGSCTLEVVTTPGHSAGHIVLVERDRGWCFSGDIFARERMKFIRPEEDMGQMVASLKKLIALDTDRLILFTSIGRIVTDGRTALRDCVAYVEGLSRQAGTLEKEGLDSDAIVAHLFGGEHAFAAMTDGQYTAGNLIRSVLRMGV